MLRIEQRRNILLAKIEEFNTNAAKFIPQHILDLAESENTTQTRTNDSAGKSPLENEDDWIGLDSDLAGVTEDDSGDLNTVDGGDSDVEVGAEKRTLFFPSSFGPAACRDPTMVTLAEVEFKLRRGQLYDTLRSLRIAVGHKSVVFRVKTLLFMLRDTARAAQPWSRSVRACFRS